MIKAIRTIMTRAGKQAPPAGCQPLKKSEYYALKIAFLLAEVDRLTASNENHAAVSAEWRTKYQALADKERESAGRVLELEAQLSAPHPFLAVLPVRCQSHPIYGEERSDLTPNLCAVCGYWTKL